MSLNKHDLSSYRRAKRNRALKIDLMIVVLFLLAAIFIFTDHRPLPAGSPGFHPPPPRVQAPAKTENAPLARAPNS